jgi:DNA-binding PadR family transcriptional regulator
LIDAGTAGRGMIERILRDLESAGYIVRERGCITLFEEVAQ